MGFFEGGHPSVTQEDARREQERQAAAAKAREDAARQAELRSLFPRAERGDVAAMRRIADLLAQSRGFTVDERSVEALAAMGVGAYFSYPYTIVCPPITDFESFAVRLHEHFHGVAGPCSGREPHRPDQSVTRWHHCLECERLAWQGAFEAVPFTSEMFRRLQRSLGTYRNGTPAGREATAAADRLMHFSTFYGPKQARLAMGLRQELVNGWQQECAEARRPTPGTIAYCRQQLAQAMGERR